MPYQAHPIPMMHSPRTRHDQMLLERGPSLVACCYAPSGLALASVLLPAGSQRRQLEKTKLFAVKRGQIIALRSVPILVTFGCARDTEHPTLRNTIPDTTHLYGTSSRHHTPNTSYYIPHHTLLELFTIMGFFLVRYFWVPFWILFALF